MVWVVVRFDILVVVVFDGGVVVDVGRAVVVSFVMVTVGTVVWRGGTSRRRRVVMWRRGRIDRRRRDVVNVDLVEVGFMCVSCGLHVNDGGQI